MKKHLPSLSLLTSAIASVILTGCGGGSGGSSHTSKSSLAASSIPTSSVASNSAPIFISGSTISVDEGSKTVTGYIANASDSNNDILTYSLSGGADKASFVIDSKTGVVSFIVAPDFEQPADSNHDNVYELQITVNDGKGGVAAQSLQVTVKDVSVKLTGLSKDDTTKIVPGNTLTAQSSCTGCDETATHYEWFVEGNETPVSITKNYQVQAADRFKKITIKATPYSASGEAGNTENIVILRNQVKQFYFHLQEFSALKTDGTFYSWGYNALDLSEEETANISSLAHSYDRIAVVRKDGSVEMPLGTKRDDLTGVKEITECQGMFATIKNGDVFTWNFANGGNQSLGLTNVVDFACNYQAIAAIKSDGTVVTQGDASYGGSTSLSLTNVRRVVGNGSAFAAINDDGSVVTWGNSTRGGNSVGKNLINVITVTGNNGAFAAIKSDGSVVTWGESQNGGDSSGVDLTNVATVVSSGKNWPAQAFAAIKKDSSAVVWGNSSYGGYLSKPITNVSKIVGNDFGFAALKKDGTVMTWGGSYGGGEDLSGDNLTGIVEIFGGGSVFAGLTNEGDAFFWGYAGYGGTSPDVDLSPADMIVSSSLNP